jgi:hypothetical protein
MSSILLFVTFYLISTFHVRSIVGQICATDTTLTLKDGNDILFAVDKQTKTTTVDKLEANSCDCGNGDLVSQIEMLKADNTLLKTQLAGIMTMLGQLSGKTTPKLSYVSNSVATKSSTVRANAVVVVSCPTNTNLVNCANYTPSTKSLLSFATTTSASKCECASENMVNGSHIDAYFGIEAGRCVATCLEM